MFLKVHVQMTNHCSNSLAARRSVRSSGGLRTEQPGRYLLYMYNICIYIYMYIVIILYYIILYYTIHIIYMTSYTISYMHYTYITMCMHYTLYSSLWHTIKLAYSILYIIIYYRQHLLHELHAASAVKYAVAEGLLQVTLTTINRIIFKTTTTTTTTTTNTVIATATTVITSTTTILTITTVTIITNSTSATSAGFRFDFPSVAYLQFPSLPTFLHASMWVFLHCFPRSLVSLVSLPGLDATHSSGACMRLPLCKRFGQRSTRKVYFYMTTQHTRVPSCVLVRKRTCSTHIFHMRVHKQEPKYTRSLHRAPAASVLRFVRRLWLPAASPYRAWFPAGSNRSQATRGKEEGESVYVCACACACACVRVRVHLFSTHASHMYTTYFPGLAKTNKTKQ